VERARPYLHYIVSELESRNMPLEIALLPIVESGYQPFAYSKSRAAGLWQFIPSTGEVYGLRQDWWYDGRRDVIASTNAALTYLQKLHNDFGDWQLALAAYNSGEGTVGRAIKRNKEAGKPTDFWSLDLPVETLAYVPKLMAVSHLVAKPGRYNIQLSPIDNQPFLAVVDTGTQLDLAIAAKLADLTAEELHVLNPGFNHWATLPEGPHNLVLPIDKATQFKDGLASLSKEQRMRWTRYKVKQGESLGIIAKRHGSSIEALKEANNLSGNTIRIGEHLLIPRIGDASYQPSRIGKKGATVTSKGNKKIHIVKAGDTWWSLANTNKVSVTDLTKWNNKSPRDTLNLGQKLVVWTQQTPHDKHSNTKVVNYKIQSGDSLWKISRKFNVSVIQVREWNGLSTRTLLRPGQMLTLYVEKS
jgi:membrane-bound lytic murein transglycosylase D